MYPHTSTSIPHYWIPILLPTEHPHISTSRRSLCRQYRLVAYRHAPLHLKHDSHLLHAKNSTGLGTPTICKQRCTGTPEMLLLSSPVAMDSPRLSNHEPDHRQPNNSPPNDLRKVNLPTLIPRIETSTGRPTLGVRLAPDGSFTQELAHCQDQALTWVHNIRASPLTRDKVYTAYCSMWRPSFDYSLPITCYTKQQCQTLQKTFTGPFLSKMGISSKTSRKLIFAPYYCSTFSS